MTGLTEEGWNGKMSESLSRKSYPGEPRDCRASRLSAPCEQFLDAPDDLRDPLFLLQDAGCDLLGRQVGDVPLGARVLAGEVAGATGRWRSPGPEALRGKARGGGAHSPTRRSGPRDPSEDRGALAVRTGGWHRAGRRLRPDGARGQRALRVSLAVRRRAGSLRRRDCAGLELSGQPRRCISSWTLTLPGPSG